MMSHDWMELGILDLQQLQNNTYPQVKTGNSHLRLKDTVPHLFSSQWNAIARPPAGARNQPQRGLFRLDPAERVLHGAGAEPARRVRGPGRRAGGIDGGRVDALRRHRHAQVRHLFLHGRRARLGEWIGIVEKVQEIRVSNWIYEL